MILCFHAAASGPVFVSPAPFAGLLVVTQPASCRAGKAMLQQPAISLIDAYHNEVLASSVQDNRIEIYATLSAPQKSESQPSVKATLFRAGCLAACRSQGLKSVCSDLLRAQGDPAVCANLATASAGMPAAYTDLTVDLPGTYRLIFTSSPSKRG